MIAYVVILCSLSQIHLIVWVGKVEILFKSVWVCLFLKCRRHYVNHIVTQVLACLSIHGVNIVHIRSVIVQAVISMYPYCTSVSSPAFLCVRVSSVLHVCKKKSPVLLCSALCFWCKFKWQYFYFVDRKCECTIFVSDQSLYKV